MKTVSCKDFDIIIDKETFSLSRNGTVWFTLPVRSAVDLDGSADIDEPVLKFSEYSTETSSVFTWSTVSNNWSKKDYILTVLPDSFLFNIKLYGNGAIDKIRYFADKNLTRYDVSSYVIPNANHTNKIGNTRLINEDGQIKLWYTAPTVQVFPFSMEDEAGVLGLGLVARKNEYNFDVFNYVAPMQFELPLYNRTVVNGVYETQGILGIFGETEEQIFSDYTEWHFANGYAERHKGEIPDWWKEPIFCGWGEQRVYMQKDNITFQRDAATQKNYTEMMERLDKENLGFGTIIIDAKWQTHFGRFDVDTDKWQDLRGFVDEQHKKGRKVLLWIKSWDAEGLDYTECTQWMCNGITSDPTNPQYIERVKKGFYKLLSSDEGCFDCDGFKVDFVNCIPPMENSITHGNICGIELIKSWMSLVYNTAKAIKPDALINTSCAHPYFTENVDMPRIHDYRSEQRSAVSVMDWRKTIFAAANPNMPIDMDSGGNGSKRDFHRYMRYQAENGVPTLYWLNESGLSPLENVPFDKEDYDVIRECLEKYQQKLK